MQPAVGELRLLSEVAGVVVEPGRPVQAPVLVGQDLAQPAVVVARDPAMQAAVLELDLLDQPAVVRIVAGLPPADRRIGRVLRRIAGASKKPSSPAPALSAMPAMLS